MRGATANHLRVLICSRQVGFLRCRERTGVVAGRLRSVFMRRTRVITLRAFHSCVSKARVSRRCDPTDVCQSEPDILPVDPGPLSRSLQARRLLVRRYSFLRQAKRALLRYRRCALLLVFRGFREDVAGH